MVNVEVPERYTARFTIESECKETEKGYYIGDHLELSVGSYAEITTKYTNASGKIISIKELR